MLRKPEISASLMGHLARMQTLPLLYIYVFVQKAFLLGLFSGSLFSEGLIVGRNFVFQNGLGLTIKQLALTVHGLIFGRSYYPKDFCF